MLLAERGLASLIIDLVQWGWFLNARLPMLTGTDLYPPIKQSHLHVSEISIVFNDLCHAYMQGFQCMVEDLTGFGHFTYELLQLLGDDYPRSPIKLYALRMSQQAASPPVRPSPP